MRETQDKAASKHERTCISCGSKSAKAGLLRIVRTTEGVVFDAGGRMPGRGAYVCSVSCFEDAARKGRLDRALRCRLTDEDYRRIAASMMLAPAKEN